MIRSTLLVVGLAGCLARPAAATDVTVLVSGVVGSAGVVRVAICLAQEYGAAHCSYRAHVPARPGQTDVILRDIPPGRYAVLAHHDPRGDGVVRKNWLGIPVDGVGVSRNAQGWFGPPAFDRVSIDVAGPAVTVPIVLRQEPGA